jgi:hypothetical protein
MYISYWFLIQGRLYVTKCYAFAGVLLPPLGGVWAVLWSGVVEGEMIGVGMANFATARQLSDTLPEFGNNRSVRPNKRSADPRRNCPK